MELLAEATQHLHEGRPDLALPLAKHALSVSQHPNNESLTATASLPALTLLAEINLELGNPDTARDFFLQAVSLDPDGGVPDHRGGGAEKFLQLAQLCEERGAESVEWFERGVSILRTRIAALLDSNENRGEGDAGDEEMRALKRKLASALCGIVEVYMTDLSWEVDAEARCETLVTEALMESPNDPIPLQTLASVRISQGRIPEAQKALSESMEIWMDGEEDRGQDSALAQDISADDGAGVGEESNLTPDFPTRISLARLLMEVSLEEAALSVVERLVQEDDESVEAWYLGGWCLYLLGEKQTSGPKPNGDAIPDGNGGDELRIASLVSSREWLRQSLALYERVEYEDVRLREHVVELVGELDGLLEGVEVEGQEEGGEGDEGWESEEGEGEGVDGDVEMGDGG
ncbi:hypothetical protein ACLMJK_003899 [Lecanora helva]